MNLDRSYYKRSSNLTPARELNQLIQNLRFKDDKGVANPAYAAVYNLKLLVKLQEVKAGMSINHLCKEL